eukprot:5258027-Prorocentrum_lima.AAC.1
MAVSPDADDSALPFPSRLPTPGHPGPQDDMDESLPSLDTPTIVVDSTQPATATPVHPPLDTATLVQQVMDQSSRNFQM